MRTALLAFLVFGAAATNAQLSLVPQIGFDNTRTTVDYNENSSFAPLGRHFSPQLNLRLDYRFKKGHGPFVGFGTNKSVAAYNFSSTENGADQYTASAENLRLRLEGGYQISSKRIYFKSKPAPAAKTVVSKTQVKKSCGGYVSKSNCGPSRSSAYKTIARTKERGWWMTVQPLAGVAFIPDTEDDVVLKTANRNNYTYRAGNWNTAFLGGVNMEFGKNSDRKFVVGVNYLKGLGIQTETITENVSNKAQSAYLNSRTSTWSLTAGIPITLSKTQSKYKQAEERRVIQKVIEKKVIEKKCSDYYKTRCRRAI